MEKQNSSRRGAAEEEENELSLARQRRGSRGATVMKTRAEGN